MWSNSHSKVSSFKHSPGSTTLTLTRRLARFLFKLRSLPVRFVSWSAKSASALTTAAWSYQAGTLSWCFSRYESSGPICKRCPPRIHLLYCSLWRRLHLLIMLMYFLIKLICDSDIWLIMHHWFTLDHLTLTVQSGLGHNHLLPL